MFILQLRTVGDILKFYELIIYRKSNNFVDLSLETALKRHFTLLDFT